MSSLVASRPSERLGFDADAAPIALVQLDTRRRVSGMNGAAENMLGASKKAMHGRALSEIVFHDSPLFDLLDKAEAMAGDLSAAAVPVSGPFLGALSLDVHISATAEGAAIALSSSLARDADPGGGLAPFARILGHEVKNPLAGISGAAQLLLRAAREDQKQLLELVRQETGRIERLINRLSVFELFSAPRRQRFNIHELLDRVIASEVAAFVGELHVERRYDPSLPDVVGDADHVHEAVQNLIRNAAEAAGTGRVAVATAYEPGLSLAPAGGQLSRAVRVTVEDDGPGIPTERLPRIFEMFHTTKPSGSGLGLSVVREVAAAHGGQVSVDSRPGRTRISIFLPLSRPGARG